MRRWQKRPSFPGQLQRTKRWQFRLPGPWQIAWTRPGSSAGWSGARHQIENFSTGRFSQAVIELVPDHLLTLGRFFPFFRAPIARYMINDTCVTNAAYSLSTGMAEIIPFLGIPLVLTDMVILTKNQLFMVYKLGLTFGFSTRWQDYVGEFGSVLGSGFVWRQIARSLVGLIPVWGIAPKTAIAYAGTYVIGNAVLQWYLTGRHLSCRADAPVL